MKTIRETESYRLIGYRLMGVTRFIRKSDDNITLLNTSSEADDERELVAQMTDEEFDAYASKQEFQP